MNPSVFLKSYISRKYLPGPGRKPNEFPLENWEIPDDPYKNAWDRVEDWEVADNPYGNAWDQLPTWEVSGPS